MWLHHVPPNNKLNIFSNKNKKILTSVTLFVKRFLYYAKSETSQNCTFFKNLCTTYWKGTLRKSICMQSRLLDLLCVPFEVKLHKQWGRHHLHTLVSTFCRNKFFECFFSDYYAWQIVCSTSSYFPL